MLDLRDRFALSPDRIWLNCAHQGPIPRAAADALHQAAKMKLDPRLISDASFAQIPHRLKRALGQLVDVPPNEIILGNSTSYGLHLLVNGICWRDGDEVVVLEDDFPATTRPWHLAARHGVTVRTIRCAVQDMDPARLAGELRPATRAFCTSWVNSFTGYSLDLSGLGAVCRERDVLFIVNGSQGVGHRTLAADAECLDALCCCGFKWLCGPYATGFCWIRPEVRADLITTQSYWLAAVAADGMDLGQENLETSGFIPEDLRFDVFCPANFFNALPWLAALELLADIGMANIEQHDAALGARLRQGLDQSPYDLVSPREGRHCSPIIVISHRERDRNGAIHQRLTEAGIDCALRHNRIRLAPHLYNSLADIDHTIERLHRCA